MNAALRMHVKAKTASPDQPSPAAGGAGDGAPVTPGGAQTENAASVENGRKSGSPRVATPLDVYTDELEDEHEVFVAISEFFLHF